LRRAAVHEITAGAFAVVSVELQVKVFMPPIVADPEISFLRRCAHTEEQGHHADYRYPCRNIRSHKGRASMRKDRTLSLARRDRWVLFPLTQTVLWVHRWLGAVVGDCAFSISARHKLKNALMIIATIGPLELAGLVAAYASTSRTRTESVELARQCWKAVLTG
jgi:hypothetical protein